MQEPTSSASYWSSAADPSDGSRQAPHGYWQSWVEARIGRWTRGPGKEGPFRRERENQLAGGIAAGIAAKTGFDVSAVRLVLIVATLFSGGLAAAGYVVCWLVVPAAGAESSIGSRALSDKSGIAQAAGLASLIGIGLIVASIVQAVWLTSLAFPIIVCADGLLLIWRNAPDDEQVALRRLAGPVLGIGSGARGPHPVRRLLIAAVLLVVGLYAVLNGHARFAALKPLAGIVLVMAGIAVALGPWWLRIARDLVDERQARIRAEERAEMATRVHDSVLQTLALIQRRSADPQQVVRLARAQERELRSWLFDGRAPGSLDGQAATVADAVRLIQQDVEAQHGMAVDAVTVGDCELDDDLGALLAAAREATVNAAKWSGAEVVSLFAEVEPEAVSLFVRDRGRGFDPDAVPPDRKGLTESVRARVGRRGGVVKIRSAPGEGTEVTLSMARAAADRLPRRT
jgi:signal transduction histidine kinase